MECVSKFKIFPCSKWYTYVSLYAFLSVSYFRKYRCIQNSKPLGRYVFRLFTKVHLLILVQFAHISNFRSNIFPKEVKLTYVLNSGIVRNLTQGVCIRLVTSGEKKREFYFLRENVGHFWEKNIGDFWEQIWDSFEKNVVSFVKKNRLKKYASPGQNTRQAVRLGCILKLYTKAGPI